MNRSTIVGLLVVVCAAICSPQAFAGYLMGNGLPLPMLDARVRVTIDNQVAVTRIEQTYHNPNSYTIEATYRFPLGEKASVQEFGLTGPDGVRQAGSIEEKGEAATIYQNAQQQGVMPAIAQSVDQNSFETKVGAIGPNSRATLDLTYSEILPYHNGQVQYSLPMNIQKLQQKTLSLVSVIIELKDQKSIIKVDSPTHPVHITKVSDQHTQIAYERSNELPARDFQVNYEVQAPAMGINFLSTKPLPKEDGYFMLMLAPAEVVDAAEIGAKDIVFVMDVSGSMSGHKIQQTREAFEFFVARLNPDDHFNVITFSSDVQPWQKELLPATQDNKVEAQHFISRSGPGGGTNIDGVLATSIGMFRESKATKVIVFLTDGEASTGETDSLVIAARMKERNTLGVRLFSLGVGDDVRPDLLDKLALENRGEALYIRQNEHIQSKLTSFYETISQPLLVDLKIDWGDIQVTDCYPPTLPNVYKGSQVVIMGRYTEGGVSNIKIHGNINGSEREFPITGDFSCASSDNRFVARQWAKAKAEHLIQEMSAYGDDPAKREMVIGLSKAYQFTTPYTSFVAVAPVQVARNTNLDRYRTARATGFSQHAVPTPVQAMAMPQSNPVLPAPVIPAGPPKIVHVETNAPAQQPRLWGAFGFFPAAILAPNFRKAREQAREKACYANMRILLGAIEMYNMDHSIMMNEVPDDVMTSNCVLVHGKYLRNQITPPEQTCSYYGSNIVDGGLIYCASHGSVESPECDAVPPGQAVKIVRTDTTPWTTRAWNAFLPLIELLINIPLLLIGLYFSLKLITLPFRLFAAVFGIGASPDDSDPFAIAEGLEKGKILPESKGVPASEPVQHI